MCRRNSLHSFKFSPFCKATGRCVVNPLRGNPGANLNSISHRCYLREVACEWELTEKTSICTWVVFRVGTIPSLVRITFAVVCWNVACNRPEIRCAARLPPREACKHRHRNVVGRWPATFPRWLYPGVSGRSDMQSPLGTSSGLITYAA